MKQLILHHEIDHCCKPIFKITEPVTDVTPVELYTNKDEDGKLITIVGGGDTGTGLTGPIKADKITRAATNKIDGIEDQWIFFRFDPPHSKNSTPLEGVSGPGDNGWPAIAEIDGQKFRIGVSLHQRDKGREGIYGVVEYYTRISHYKSWIDEMIQK